MLLKNNPILKYFAILLFVIELLAPIFLATQPGPADIDGQRSSLHSSSTAFALFATILSEEAGGEEERDGKEHKRNFFPFTEFDSALFYSHSVIIEKISLLKGCSTKGLDPTPLYTLYRAFRI